MAIDILYDFKPNPRSLSSPLYFFQSPAGFGGFQWGYDQVAWLIWLTQAYLNPMFFIIR